MMPGGPGNRKRASGKGRHPPQADAGAGMCRHSSTKIVIKGRFTRTVEEELASTPVPLANH